MCDEKASQAFNAVTLFLHGLPAYGKNAGSKSTLRLRRPLATNG
jgi:hypothetical protein